MHPHLRQRRLEDLSPIAATWLVGQLGSHDLLVIAYRGAYREGPAGDLDAEAMLAQGKAGLSAFPARALVIDLTELEYRGGEALEAVLGLGRPDMPVAVVSGPHSDAALRELLPGLEAAGLFADLASATAHLLRALQRNGETALHRAARSGDGRAVEDLLLGGAEVDPRDPQGNTPLHLARGRAVVRALLKRGADPEARNELGMTPLHCAQELEVARLLVGAGADPDARSRWGHSPLHGARSPELVRFLVEAGADPLVRHRTSVLHCANDLAVAEALILAGAPLDQKDEQGRTPLDRALEAADRFASQARALGSKERRQLAARWRRMVGLLRVHGARRATESGGNRTLAAQI